MAEEISKLSFEQTVKMSNKNMAKETFRDVEKSERTIEYQEFIQIIKTRKSFKATIFEIKKASTSKIY